MDAALVTLPAVRGAVETMEPIPERMQLVLWETLLATDVADELAGEGVPFREAHGLAGRLVREAEDLGVSLRELPAERARKIHEVLPDVLGRLGSFEDSFERPRTPGGTSRASVEPQLGVLERAFAVRSPPEAAT